MSVVESQFGAVQCGTVVLLCARDTYYWLIKSLMSRSGLNCVLRCLRTKVCAHEVIWMCYVQVWTPSPGLMAKKTVKIRRVSFYGAQYDACESRRVQGIYIIVFTLLGLGLSCMDYQSRLLRVIE